MISLILGLGNIGKRYRGTRHNLGFEVADRLIEKTGASPQARLDLYDWAVWKRDSAAGDRQIIIAKPRTYMNLSGLAAARLLEAHSFAPAEMLVIVDDFALPIGAVRIRPKGSAGSHNGLSSIIEVIATEEFPRIRLGLGSPAPQTEQARQSDEQIAGKSVDKYTDIVDFVLSPFEPEERPAVDKMIAHAVDAVLFAIDHRLDEAMSKYNSNPALPESL